MLALFFSSAALAAVDDSEYFLLAALILGVVLLVQKLVRPVFGWSAIGVVTAATGALTFGPLFLVPFTVIVLGSTSTAWRAGALLLLVTELAPRIGIGMAAASPSFITSVTLLLPTFWWVLAVNLTTSRKLLAMAGAACTCAVLSVLLSNEWLAINDVTAPTARFLFNTLLILIATPLTESLYGGKDIPEPTRFRWITFATSSVLIVLIITAFKGDPVQRVVFDESHGEWASTQVEFNPESFGREKTYSYRVLASLVAEAGYSVHRHTDKAAFPSELNLDSIFVLKMPTDSFQKNFTDDALRWVQRGGRLLVISDHTDLFDTTQNVNVLLEKIGVKIASTAVFDRTGRPPESFDWDISRLESISDRPIHRYLTGASFERLDWAAMPLKTYGASFVEGAVYFNPNRFGYFNPTTALPYSKNISVAQLSYGKGSVQIWLDSTPWSTFSVFSAKYQDAFYTALKVLEQNVAPRIYPIAMFLALVLTVIFIVVSNKMVALGLIISMSAILTTAASMRGFPNLIHASPQSILLHVGRNAGTELLTSLVHSPDRNFARAATSLQKLGDHVRLEKKSFRLLDSVATTLIWLDPDAADLPKPSDVFALVEQGRKVIVILSPAELPSRAIREWCFELGFGLRRERALAITANSSVPIEGRRSAYLMRETTARLTPLNDSMWVETRSTPLAQHFRNRATRRDPPGELVLGTRADQFSDSTMGDVWDGVPVDDLARTRERELALLVKTVSQNSLTDSGYAYPGTAPLRFQKYLVVKSGKIFAEGVFKKANRTHSKLSMAEDPDAFLKSLQRQVLFFMARCPANNIEGYCTATFVDSNLTEWFVIPKRVGSKVVSIELIHDARLSNGLSSVNVLFE